MPAETLPKVRVVVRLPWNRPEQAPEDPPNVQWTAEKADILWKGIEQSRSRDNRANDYKALAARLDVPLPYLLYRVHARFQEELKGLQDLQGALSSLPPNGSPEIPLALPQTVASRAADRLGLSSSSRLSTPLGVRARLNSLGHNTSSPHKTASSSTLTIQKPSAPLPHSHPSPTASSDGSGSDSEGSAEREDDAGRSLEEQEALDRKLADLQRMMTNDALGLVSAPRAKIKGKAPAPLTDLGPRGRVAEVVSSRSGSTSQSLSSAGSARSIPDIPSPSSASQPASRHMSPTTSGSPPALSPRRPGHRSALVVARSLSEQSSSNQGSTASSFSDISDLSASALESVSNTRAGHSSRFSAFGITRSRFGPRSGIPQ
ncbi:hypothetical protein BD626DRAFT_106986 [Schizophyllum amplum]|uniref:Atg29 N-terminal domain-containing protein n=1 Tax=Schizophyllum amplum TaxID=97359 RepID=A0A550CST6_9AGAR|nr:hypothetical protein BD626DRAFT_106986 [Auriculariopsis ampla]